MWVLVLFGGGIVYLSLFMIKWTIIIANNYYRNKLACCYLYVDIHTSNERTLLV